LKLDDTEASVKGRETVVPDVRSPSLDVVLAKSGGSWRQARLEKWKEERGIIPST